VEAIILWTLLRVFQRPKSEAPKGQGDCIGENDMGRTSQRKHNMGAIESHEEVISRDISFMQFSRMQIL